MFPYFLIPYFATYTKLGCNHVKTDALELRQKKLDEISKSVKFMTELHHHSWYYLTVLVILHFVTSQILNYTIHVT